MTPRKSKVTMRMLEERDLPAIAELHRQQAKMLGVEMDLPALLESPVVLALVFERDGKITNCLYFEGQVEMGMIGCDSQATVTAFKAANDYKYHFRRRNIRFVRTFLSKAAGGKVEKAIGKKLKKIGFRPLDEQYSHYSLELLGAKRG